MMNYSDFSDFSDFWWHLSRERARVGRNVMSNWCIWHSYLVLLTLKSTGAKSLKSLKSLKCFTLLSRFNTPKMILVQSIQGCDSEL